MEVDAEFLEALSKLSDNIKLITMDNGEPGTCIIGLPSTSRDDSARVDENNVNADVKKTEMTRIWLHYYCLTC